MLPHEWKSIAKMADDSRAPREKKSRERKALISILVVLLVTVTYEHLTHSNGTFVLQLILKTSEVFYRKAAIKADLFPVTYLC